MEIILLKDLNKVGEKHEIITVKNGYGRNYLIPQKLAVIANKINRDKLDELKAKEQKDSQRKLASFKQIMEKAQSKVLKIAVKAGTSNKIFGSVTTVQILQALKEQVGVEVDRKTLEIKKEVKELGEYEATLALHPEVAGAIKFLVEAD